MNWYLQRTYASRKVCITISAQGLLIRIMFWGAPYYASSFSFFFMFFHRKIFNAQENQTFSWIKVTFFFWRFLWYSQVSIKLPSHELRSIKGVFDKFFHSKILLKVFESIQQVRFYQLQKMIVSLTDKLNNRKRKGETCQIRAKGDKLSIARFYLETRGGKSESWQPLSSPLRMLELALQLVGSLYTMGTEVL